MPASQTVATEAVMTSGRWMRTWVCAVALLAVAACAKATPDDSTQVDASDAVDVPGDIDDGAGSDADDQTEQADLDAEPSPDLAADAPDADPDAAPDAVTDTVPDSGPEPDLAIDAVADESALDAAEVVDVDTVTDSDDVEPPDTAPEIDPDPCAVDGTPCDDGNPCTEGDACKAGACVAGAQGLCECQQNADCDKYEDGNSCNGTLVCDHSEFPYRCVVDDETIISCPALGNPTCVDSVCSTSAGGCVQVAKNEGGECSDGKVCTTGDVCKSGSCVASGLLACDDGNPCTDDLCVPEKGCLFLVNEADCAVGSKCKSGKCEKLPVVAGLYPVAKVSLVPWVWYQHTKDYQTMLAWQGLVAGTRVLWSADRVVIAWRAVAAEDCTPVRGAVVDTSVFPARVRLIGWPLTGWCGDSNEVADYFLVLPWNPSLDAVYVENATHAFWGALYGAEKLFCKTGCDGVPEPETGLALPLCDDGKYCSGQCELMGALSCWDWPETCPDELVCAGQTMCTAGQKVCAPGAVLTCNAAGNGWSVERCKPGLGLGICDESMGVAACKSAVCAPGVPYCDGQAVRACDWSGQGGEFLGQCGGTTTCQGGACVPAACPLGASHCANVGAVATCGPQGWSVTDCPAGKACNGSKCQDIVCAANERSCSGGKVMQCDATGTSPQAKETCGPDPCETIGTTALCCW